ncbi:MAG: energy-coupling factor ABC transporter permease [Coriobacteriales bacterium]|nr:energy-coupling factor ABC transporter permease [Coriobacteriales bacterium]
MHIPDGMLDTKTFTSLWAGGAGGISYASWWIRRHLDSSQLVLMAVLAALIFGLQMLNFPIAAGTSGHFSGGAAAAIILGYWPATIVMAAVLLVQALFFGDGGITTLGANIVNLGLVGPGVAVLVYQLGIRLKASRSAKLVFSFIAATLAVVASAAMVALELWASGRVPLLPALAAMIGWHTLIGLAEGVITAGLVAYLLKVRPQILDSGIQTNAANQPTVANPANSMQANSMPANSMQANSSSSPPKNSSSSPPKSSLTSVVVVLGLAALLTAGLSFLASQAPDGLEFVYFESGLGEDFAETGIASNTPFYDYLLPGVSNQLIAGIGAAIIGVVLTAALILTISILIVRRRHG